MEEPKPDTCDWSHAATESAAQARSAALKALGISNGNSSKLAELPSSPSELHSDTADCTMSPPSGPTETAAKYFWENSTNGNDNIVPIRRIQSDIQTPTPKEAEVAVVRPSQSMDQALKARKRLDKYGFIMNMDDQGNLYDDRLSSERIPTFAETKLVERREQKWNGMLSSWNKKKKRRKKLLRRLRKGVPDSLRGKVWCQMANVPYKIKVEKKGYYDKLVIETTRTLTAEDDENFDVNESPSALPKSFRATQDTIERDIHRTFPRHHLFQEGLTAEDDSDDDCLQGMCDEEVSTWISQLEKDSPSDDQSPPEYSTRKINPAIARGGQASLRRVLRAYSYHDAEVGYCQGMNFIAAMFLTFTSEEEAFWLLVAVMNDPPGRMRGMFGREMQAAHQVLYVAEKLIVQFLPRLARHLEAENVHITMYATQWFLTIYTSSFRFDLVTRVWDCFLAEGWKVVYRTMLALMQQSMPDLMILSFEEILAYFRDLPEKVSGDRVMETALKIPLKRKHIVKYENEWLANNPQT